MYVVLCILFNLSNNYNLILFKIGFFIIRNGNIIMRLGLKRYIEIIEFS